LLVEERRQGGWEREVDHMYEAQDVVIDCFYRIFLERNGRGYRRYRESDREVFVPVSSECSAY
jgi:hypothetical protein